MGAPKGNTNALGNNGGAPPIHTDPKHLEHLVKDYFEWIEGEWHEEIVETIEEDIETGERKKVEKKIKVWDRNPEPPTVTGLSLHVGFSSKSTLYEYSKKIEFSDSIKKGLTRIEKFHETKVTYGDKCTGNIFALKNFGWKDNVGVDHTTNGESMNIITLGSGIKPPSND